MWAPGPHTDVLSVFRKVCRDFQIVKDILPPREACFPERNIQKLTKRGEHGLPEKATRTT
jgi:hypothetical protein